MREKPSGEDLLEIAREVLKNDLLPALPKEHHYSALMIANAMSIVMRQIQADETSPDPETTELSQLIGENGELEDLNRTLAIRIRNGEISGKEVWGILNSISKRKVSESNPKYL